LPGPQPGQRFGSIKTTATTLPSLSAHAPSTASTRAGLSWIRRSRLNHNTRDMSPSYLEPRSGARAASGLCWLRPSGSRLRLKSDRNHPISACRQLGHMSQESTHIMEQIWENPLFWLSYPQPPPTFTHIPF
jgi:hypothetical protein